MKKNELINLKKDALIYWVNQEIITKVKFLGKQIIDGEIKYLILMYDWKEYKAYLGEIDAIDTEEILKDYFINKEDAEETVAIFINEVVLRTRELYQLEDAFTKKRQEHYKLTGGEFHYILKEEIETREIYEKKIDEMKKRAADMQVAEFILEAIGVNHYDYAHRHKEKREEILEQIKQKDEINTEVKW